MFILLTIKIEKFDIDNSYSPLIFSYGRLLVQPLPYCVFHAEILIPRFKFECGFCAGLISLLFGQVRLAPFSILFLDRCETGLGSMT